MKAVVIFGGSGNLAMLKLVYEIYKLKDKDIKVILYGRSDMTKSYKDKLLEFHEDYTPEFLDQVCYVQGSYDDLSELVSHCDDDTLLYFATPSFVFETLLESVHVLPHKRIALEKPFGDSIDAFRNLKLTEKCVFVDHYLAKPMSLAFPHLFLEKRIFKNILNPVFIEKIDVMFMESLLADGIANFDKNGTMKDVMQNHMLEMIGVILSKPDEINEKKMAEGRAEIIDSISIDKDSLITGQYEGYQIENSKTETFVSFDAIFDKGEYKDVKVNFTAGKALDKKMSCVVLHIKTAFVVEFMQLLELDINIIPKNVKLVFSFLKEEGIWLEIDAVNVESNKTLVTWLEIRQILHDRFDGFFDYAHIFDTLINNKSIALALKSDVEAAWNTMECILDKPNKLYIYKQNVKPSEILKENASNK